MAFYPWIKAFHLIFMVTWFAGLFYLPRLFIYHAEADDQPGRERFGIMEKRLFAIMTIGAALTWLFGALLLVLNSPVLGLLWLQIKLLLLAALLVFHWRCWLWIARLAARTEPQDSRWLRYFNEIPVIFLFGIVLLAVIRPV